MSFASLEFVAFFPIVTLIYFLLPQPVRWLHLLAASVGFYVYFAPRYILILAFTIVVDYFAGILIESAVGARRRAFLWASLAANLGVLGFFKYYAFVTENIEAISGFLGHRSALPVFNLLLPIGLSFHTFQAMSYTIEVYRGNQRAERHFGIYALYVMFYPQLVAGPIERPQNVLHQFHERHAFDYDRATSGLRLMLWGTFKKIVVADRLAVLVDGYYKNPGGASGGSALLAASAFTVQVYADFAGYSDIAIGSARVMGIDLMMNFDAPLRASSVAEFWRRWHISLSTWFNDYVFTPLFTSLRHRGRAALAFSIIVTFLLSGVWHGAGWTFVVYGLLHGIALVYEALTRKQRKRLARALGPRIYDVLARVSLLAFVTLGFVFFRAATLEQAALVIRRIVAFWTPGYFDVIRSGTFPVAPWKLVLSFVPAIVLLVVEHWNRDHRLTTNLGRLPRPAQWSVYYGVLASIMVFGAFESKQFIYFQF